MTDNQLIKELNQMAFIAERRAERKAIFIRNAVARIEELTAERDEARRDCAVALVDKLFVNTAANLNYGGYGEAKEFKPSSKDTPVIYLSGTCKEFKARL